MVSFIYLGEQLLLAKSFLFFTAKNCESFKNLWKADRSSLLILKFKSKTCLLPFTDLRLLFKLLFVQLVLLKVFVNFSCEGVDLPESIFQISFKLFCFIQKSSFLPEKVCFFLFSAKTSSLLYVFGKGFIEFPKLSVFHTCTAL